MLNMIKLTQNQFNKMETIKPIRTRTDYKNALKRIDELILKNPKKKSKEYDELDVLGTLVSSYENIHFPITAPTPIETIKYIMEENGLKSKDLVPYFGSKGIVSEFFSQKRQLTLRSIKLLHEAFGIPYESLIA